MDVNRRRFVYEKGSDKMYDEEMSLENTQVIQLDKEPKRRKRGKKKGKKKLNKVWRVIKRVLISFCLVFVLLAAIVAGAALGFIDNSTDLIAQEYSLDFTSVVYYTNESGQAVELERLYAEQNRVWVDIENTPEMLKKAFIAIEDERFLSHKGVDWKRTLGATMGYIFKGNSSYGGSTITQQLIKNITGDDERSAIRKIQEIVRALNLEKKMSKDEIIEMYMNTIYLGQGCHGVQTAANIYYSKDVSELDLAECASIAGITQYPSKYDPLINFEEHKKKQELVLGKMLELGFISQEEHDAAVAEELKLVKGTVKVEKSSIQSYYVDKVIEDVMHDLMTQNKMSESAATKAIFKGGLKIYANVDPKVQEAMETVFENDNNFPGAAGSKPQSSMVVIDPYTGQVKGIVGGRGEKTGNRVLNRTTTLRQPGSSIKPLAVYAPAIEYGLITPGTLVDDLPLTIRNWSPKNADNSFLGPITARVALEKSRNIPAVRILDELTVDRSYDFMTNNLGFTTLVSSEKRADNQTYSDKYLSSLGLGGLTDGVSVMEMTAAYATFVNGGIYTKPTTYSKVVDANGKVILENKPETKYAMSETTAYTMAQMLSGVVNYGTGTGARLANGVFAGGKTGTTDKDTNRWFAGFTPNYVGVVWFGYDTPKPMTGLGNPCLSAWKKVMDSIHQGITVKELTPPQNMVSRTICQVSGKIAGEDCAGSVRTEYFKSGTQPGTLCRSHAIEEQESDIGEEIIDEGQGLNEVEPGSGANNPPAEGEPIQINPPNLNGQGETDDGGSTNVDDESQYWWDGDE
ncbi:MAG: PBP1A family penicillin-binding protein [Ruminococcaceae bacterium]|nr:PBP1A family penicillin-binding protein [Oscillospiraceae bacterium]